VYPVCITNETKINVTLKAATLQSLQKNYNHVPKNNCASVFNNLMKHWPNYDFHISQGSVKPVLR